MAYHEDPSPDSSTGWLQGGCCDWISSGLVKDEPRRIQLLLSLTGDSQLFSLLFSPETEPTVVSFQKATPNSSPGFLANCQVWATEPTPLPIFVGAVGRWQIRGFRRVLRLCKFARVLRSLKVITAFRAPRSLKSCGGCGMRSGERFALGREAMHAPGPVNAKKQRERERETGA